jgi:hypothetical protein
MPKSIIIASLEFPSKKAAKEFFRNLRDRYADGERIPHPDDAHLRRLIAIHTFMLAATGPYALSIQAWIGWCFRGFATC